MDARIKVRSRLSRGELDKRYKAGRNKSLDRIGSFTMQAAKKQFLNKAPKKKPLWRRVGQQGGVPVLEVSFRPPTAGRVTSWKTGRGRAANGFLRSSIRYERDDRRGSVVIGPAERSVWLNRIQEFGGSRPVSYRYLTGQPIKKLKSGHVVPKGMGTEGGVGGGAYVVMRRDAMTGKRTKAGEFRRESGRVKKGQYMAGGLNKVRPKIPQQFRNFISGP